MASLGKFGALRTKFAGLVDFVTVYIAEAHPAEKKHFSGNFDIASHASMRERMEAANTLKEEAGQILEGCPILVDPMDDRANLAYAALPERLYVVQDGKITYEGGVGPRNYSIDELDAFLSKGV
eukprot:TRINITY_DN24214_c0_g1_i1.p2 TRINITY_DN24214_c0_g1~~TRINITY_DN24214_c0_g1_i1.p2  ORF type:complete len:124 (-),score=40.21 TRINITY_DN24214_c0_g1_i1:113-484(-)